ncbi:MAG: protein kinase [bacterium]|nr:protein kinase [bacterium]
MLVRGQTNDPLIGREIDGYRIERMLGEGGMARVYRAYDVNLHRYVAIKVIDPQQGSNPKYEERFKQEARAVAQLEHPNIVSIYRFNQVKGIYYIAMRYIEGSDLRWVLHDYHSEGELMPHNALVEIISQIARALDFAHSKGVIHRDVKPSNIMLEPNGTAILTDFGLALVTSESTKGEAFGSPHYIAPEQAIGAKGVVPQSDLYSLGVILYEALTGRVPFNEGSAMQIAMAHISDEPPDPLSLNPTLHPAFIPVLQTALAKEPRDRYQTGAKLVTALRAAVKQAKEDSLDTRPATKSRSRKGSTSPLNKPRTVPRSESDSAPPLRLSMIELPEKVEKFRKANPLPPVPPSESKAPALPYTDQTAAPKAWRPESTLADATPMLRKEQSDALERKRTTSAAGTANRKSLLIGLVVIGLVIALAVGAFVVSQSGSGAGVAAALPTTMVMEGIVTAIDGQTVTIFDTPFVLEDDAALAQLAVGQNVRLEGNFIYEDGRIRVRRVNLLQGGAAE